MENNQISIDYFITRERSCFFFFFRSLSICVCVSLFYNNTYNTQCNY